MRPLLAILLSLTSTPVTWAEPQHSCSNTDALGVSRVAEIDTREGHALGSSIQATQASHLTHERLW